MELPVLSVSEISFFIKEKVENFFPIVKIIGEVSNFTKHTASGHLYFSLKDSESLIKAVCFKEQAKKIPFEIENGMQITVVGRLSVYVKSSNYQIIGEEVEIAGAGNLAKILEALKQKLLKEGLFDEKFKKPLPFLPSKIGLITAKSGAVLHDILKTLEARFPREVLLFPAIMQGAKTAKSVISGIKYFNKKSEVDVIIIARGGGSFEDLFEFNNEELVREVFKSKIPIISAIGHETDFTLLDFVADKRAATPTASVILAVTSREDLLAELKKKFEIIMQYSFTEIAEKERSLEDVLRGFLDLQSEYKDKIFILEKTIGQIFYNSELALNLIEKNLEKTFNEMISYDFNTVLEKGFAIVTTGKGRRLESVKRASHGEKINILLKDGELNAEVIKETLF